jgi:phosphate transport system substrate-binding protein
MEAYAFIRLLLKKQKMKSNYLIIALFAMLAFGCKGKVSTNSTPNSGKVNIACDETLRPVFEAEVDVFASIYPAATITCSYHPSNKAFELLFADSVKAVISTRKLSASEMTAFEKKTIFPRQALVAVDAIALIVNSSNKDTMMTVDQVRDILTGKITNWNQISPKSPKKPIRVVFDNEQSSIVSYFADSICNGKMDVKKLFALTYNADVIDYVIKNPDVLGFIGVNWISNRNDSLHLSFHKSIKAVAVSSGTEARDDNSYLPYQAYMVDQLYPFTRNIYYVDAEPYNGLATGFSNFVASEKGQRIILKSGILPAIAPTRMVKVRSDF